MNYQKYKKVNNQKELLKLNFSNFKIPNEFFERIKNNHEFHYLYRKNNLLTYGWSSKNEKFFLFQKLIVKLKIKKNVIFF